MKAINLIPAESRSGGSRSGGAAYVLLGVLALLLVGVAFHVLTSNAIAERRAELTSLQSQVQAAQAEAAARRPYREFAALAEARVTTVRQLGAARFDWQRALADVSKVIPGDVWLTSLLGTVTTGVSVEGGSSGSTGGLRSALPNPAMEITGCTTSHKAVARLISRLRLLDGVSRVGLADSAKIEGGSGCANGHEQFPQFNVVVFFDPVPAPPPPPSTAPVAATPGAVPPSPSTTP
jgi:Tfp pilus assembly protein PilN